MKDFSDFCKFLTESEDWIQKQSESISTLFCDSSRCPCSASTRVAISFGSASIISFITSPPFGRLFCQQEVDVVFRK